MRLPAILEPWAPWLALLPADLTEALGQMLLRLHPLVGRLNPVTLHQGDQPAGLGNIVRRGHYERLLMTEWVYADAAPDEFLRRAGSGELLFTGPEPSVHQRALESIVLFDAGPTQLGEPRLAQAALFILLARRAQQAGAQFRWGIWQQPGMLHEISDGGGLKKLIKARTLAADADHAGRWQAALPPALTDCWLIGPASMALPQQADATVVIRPSLLGRHLDVTLRQKHATRTLKLELPSTDDGIRLLRQLVKPAAPEGYLRHFASRPSRAQPPRFGMNGQRLAVAQLNGGAISYHVPPAVNAKPGKPRPEPHFGEGAVLAAGLPSPRLAYIRTVDNQLFFHNFPGKIFAGKTLSAPRPQREQFHAPPGMAHWLPLFYQQQGVGRVVVLDSHKQLVCWETTSQRQELVFRPMLSDVIGITEFGKVLHVACRDGDGIQLYQWHGWQDRPQKFTYLGHTGTRLLSGSAITDKTMVAIQRGEQSWWVTYGGNGAAVEVDDGATVLGLAISARSAMPGLVVLHPGRRRIELRLSNTRYELAASAEPIQQASYDAASRRVAWITARSGTVIVRGIEDEQTLLQVSGSEEEPDAV